MYWIVRKMRKGKVNTTVSIFNYHLEVEFDATLMEDGTLVMEFHEPLVIPPGHFKVAVMEDMR